MKLPNAVKVGAYSYAVERVARLCDDSYTRLNGRCNWTKFALQIDEGLPPQRERVVLLHELIHAIEDERTLDLTEAAVNQLAHGLADVLLDNPALTRLFLAEDGA